MLPLPPIQVGYPTTDQPMQADEFPWQLDFTNNISQWANADPVNEVLSKIHGYFGLPAFEYTSSMLEGGVPQVPVIILSPYIIQAWNFQATGWFVITGFPTFPTSPNYVLTIRYIQGGIVYRYKIFGFADDKVNYPLYTGQPIGPNFQLEVWNYVTAWSGVVYQLDNSLQFQTSRTQLRTSAVNATSYTLATGIGVATMFNNTALKAPAWYNLPLTFGQDACGYSN